jgi:S1-C subfamily serine protease
MLIWPASKQRSLGFPVLTTAVTTGLLLAALLTSNAAAQSAQTRQLLELQACQPPTLSIPLTIRQISVRLLNTQGSGSGVIVRQQGNIYTVLTNAHVVSSGNQYAVLTTDGQTHTGWRLNELQSRFNDLALVQFSSNRIYLVAQFRDADLRRGETVYAAGFPNWHFLSSTQLEETQDAGFQAFQLTVGQVEMLLPHPLQQGYQLGYTNNITPGMSGGPVLDCTGQLVGVNGGLSYPPQGRTAFTFANGTIPSEQLFQQMQTLSWAIPVSTIRQSLDSLILPPI